MEDDYVKDIVRQVLKVNDSKEFLNSRFEMSNIILKGGVMFNTDCRSRFCNVVNGMRITTDCQEEKENFVHIFGPCIVYGPIVDDAHTIPSYIQRCLNREGRDYNTCNYGIRGAPLIESLRSWNKIKRSGDDICVFICGPKEIPMLKKYHIDVYDLADSFNEHTDFHDYFIDVPVHCNCAANELIAERIFQKIRNHLKRPGPGNRKPQNRHVYHGNRGSKDTQYIAAYLEDISKYKKEAVCAGAVVMNCNPFTLGHRYLIQKALETVDWLYVFVVEEERSFFSFKDRRKMVIDGCSDFKNVTVLKGGKMIISAITFPEYFRKEGNREVKVDASYDLEIFGQFIAPALDIHIRFVGEEPLDYVTMQYNRAMLDLLPSYGIKVSVVQRKTVDQEIISASKVRELFQDGNWDELEKYVPGTTLRFLKEFK